MDNLVNAINFFEEMATTPHFKLENNRELDLPRESVVFGDSSTIKKLFSKNEYLPDTGKVTVI